MSTFREVGIPACNQVPGDGGRWALCSRSRLERFREVERLVESRSETFREVSDLLF